MYYELTDHFVVAADVDRTWAFFSRAENLPRITPAWMRFQVDTPGPIDLREGSLINYTIRWAGLPMRWRTRIIDWTPPRQFIDLQIRGPYTLWHHQHTFEPGPGGTMCRDRVTYRVPGGWIGRGLNRTVIRRQLIGIFEYRRKVIGEELGWVRAIQPSVAVHAIG